MFINLSLIAIAFLDLNYNYYKESKHNEEGMDSLKKKEGWEKKGKGDCHCKFT